MKEKNYPLVDFFSVNNAREKLTSICQIVQHHFLKKKRLLIAAPNEEAAQYLNGLLWKYPEESFVPHIWTESPTEECVAITCSQDNVNRASILLHLGPSVHVKWGLFQQIYELFDQTDQEKQKASEARKAYYIEVGCQVNFKQSDFFSTRFYEA
ncbi:DNA polymerase III subunit chi [Parachlamydia sp. AcF125]|uniref:DNA polymerase III subunit chi n=1 Tax=Parachlamydia sp. AcF125 TaxID=2795736 RepID=UPI001BC91094|nr:DNA polymerase III subunit chi [Parachlamydia sp. AcF125]MBS4169161.1 DNA polymerase III subunit chi [Parachlamydia sp. AcF125]